MKVSSIIRGVNNFNRNHRKENHFQKSYELLTVDNGKITELASLRIYGTNAKNYACLWITDNVVSSGSGSAGGYGYHRPSAAAEEAIASAGIKLSNPISGRGDYAIERALYAIGNKLRPRSKSLLVLTAHA